MFEEDVVKYDNMIGLHLHYSCDKALCIRRKLKTAAATFTTSASGGNYFSESDGTAAATGTLLVAVIALSMSRVSSMRIKCF